VESKDKSVSVLLSSHNGEKFIATQLDSVLAQKGVNFKIFVRDDGSQDGTCDILEKYRQEDKIDLIRGPNVGYAKSFYSLIKNAPRSDYYAFCDQDDFWEEDKLIAAVRMLEEQDKEMPLLYCSALKIVDSNLNFQFNSHESYQIEGEYLFQKSFNLANVYGCTCVFNNIARDKLLRYDYESFHSHDANLYMMASAIGKVVFDKIPHIQYRQHNNNVYGYPIFKIKNTKKVLTIYLTIHSKNLRLKEMQKIKQHFYDEMPPENQEFCDLVCNYKNSRQDKKNLLNYKPFRCEDRFMDFWLRDLIRRGKF
jgi:rhamnosyltransferase